MMIVFRYPDGLKIGSPLCRVSGGVLRLLIGLMFGAPFLGAGAPVAAVVDGSEKISSGIGEVPMTMAVGMVLVAVAAAIGVSALFFRRREKRNIAALKAESAQECALLHRRQQFVRNTAKLANIEYFHFDRGTRQSIIACDQYWPFLDGMPVAPGEWVVSEDLPSFEAAWQRLKRREISSLQTAYRAGRNGVIRYYIMHAHLYRTSEEDCTLDQYFGLIQDVTELQNSIHNYQDTTQLLRTIIENFPNPVMIKNVSDDFRCILGNCNLAQQFGMGIADTIGKTDFELFQDPQDAERIHQNDLLALMQEGNSRSEEVFRDANGVRHDAVTTRSVISRTDGTKLLVAVVTDVSELKHIQRAAEESNQILRAVLEHVHAGLTVKDRDNDFRYIIWNKWLADKTGMPAEQLLGRNDFETHFKPELQQLFRNEDLQVGETDILRTTTEHENADGKRVIFDVTKKLLTLPRGRQLLIASMSDITQERQLAHEREQMIAQQVNYIEYERIINRCLQAITLQTDLEESIAFVLREIGETTHADRCYIFQFAADDLHASNTHEWLGPDIAAQKGTLQNIDLSQYTGIFQRLRKREDIVIGDLSQPQPEDLRTTVEFIRQHQVKSVLISGIWENDRLWGFVGVDFMKTTRNLAPSDIHILRNAANLFLLLLERQSRINALADSISLQTQIFDNISVPIMLTDTEFNVVKTNSSMELLTRAPRSASGPDKCYHRFCEGKTQPPPDCPVQQVLNTGEACFRERNFGDRHVQITAQPVYDRSGKLKYVLESGFNITEIRKQQEQLAIFLKQEQIVSECLKTLVLKQDFNVALGDIILLLGKQLQMDCCAIFRYDPSDDALHDIQRWERLGEQTENPLQELIDQKSFPACFKAFQKGESVRVDLREEPASPEELELHSFLSVRGMQAVACVGIHFHGEFWGVVGMEFAGSDKYFGAAEMRLLSSAARIIEVLLERETLYAKLLNSENEKNMIWELMTVPMVLFDANRNIIRANPAMERLCGMTSTEIMSRPCFQVICKNSVPGENCPVTMTLLDQQPQHAEYTLFERDFDIFTLPVLEKGELVRILQIFIDITENNVNKRKLLHAVEAAEAAARAKSTFLATMSHEIRTPLNAVIGFSELLQSGEVAPEEHLEYLRSINFAGNALLQLINDILDLSKLEAGQMEIINEKGDLSKLCEEMMAIFSLRAKEKHLELRLDYPDNVPNLYFSVSRLRQVLLNLIGNAIKFTSRGYITLSVRFHVHDGQSGSLRIEVRDTGSGIHDDYKALIFQPFIQQNKVRGTQEGTGLGLAISKRLIEHMGGVLSMESTFGEGSCFSIVLPEIRYSEALAEAPEPVALQESMPRDRKILLVDDVPLNLKVLQAMLKQFHVEVITAASGSEALEKLTAFKPDLILTDMWMPGMNGTELAEQIRRRPDLAGVVIFAVTADSETRGSFSMDCFDGILLKPVSLKKLHKMFLRIDQHELVPGKPEMI